MGCTIFLTPFHHYRGGERDRSRHAHAAPVRKTTASASAMMRSGARGGDAEEEVDRKPVIKPGVHVTLKVQDTAGRTVVFTVRRTQELQALMDAYYASVPDVAYGTGRFLYDGGRLTGAHTPAELGMEEQDEIDFFTELLGGGRHAAAEPGRPVVA
jgi:hypothetical protein